MYLQKKFAPGVLLLLAAASTLSNAQTLKSDITVSPMCRTIQSWINSDTRTGTATSPDEVAGSLLGTSFTNAFQKEYSQVTADDFRTLRSEGLNSCSKSKSLQPGQMRIASTLLSAGYQNRWLREAGRTAPATLAPATGTGQATLAARPQQLQQQPAQQPQPYAQGYARATAAPNGAVLPSTPLAQGGGYQATGASRASLTIPGSDTTAQPQSLKSVGSDAKASLNSALANMAQQVIGAGTQAMTDRVTSITSGGSGYPSPATAAPSTAPLACPSAADMEVIRRTGSKPPAGC